MAMLEGSTTSGCLTLSEVVEGASSLGMTEEEAKRTFEQLDEDEDGFFTRDDLDKHTTKITRGRFFDIVEPPRLVTSPVRGVKPETARYFRLTGTLAFPSCGAEA